MVAVAPGPRVKAVVFAFAFTDPPALQQTRVYLILEYAPGGELYKVRRARRRRGALCSDEALAVHRALSAADPADSFSTAFFQVLQDQSHFDEKTAATYVRQLAVALKVCGSVLV